MKAAGGFVSSSLPSPTKKRWKWFVTAVLGLVFLSMLVPLFFLLGFRNGLYNGFGAEHLTSSKNVRVPVEHKIAEIESQLKVNTTAFEDVIVRKISPTSARHFENDSDKVASNDRSDLQAPASFPEHVKENKPRVRAFSSENLTIVNESEVVCALKFGTYCLWRREQREDMEDIVVKKMKDLLFVARAYYPSIAKLPKFDKLSQEMKQNIQDFERILSEASTDKDLPPKVEPKLTMMEATISKAKSCPVDCNNVDKKFRQLVDLTEDEASFHMKQSAFLYKLAVQTMPKSLHCLSMRLTVEYFQTSSDIVREVVQKFSNPDLHHYVIFSRNILASSVVINSTVVHTRESGKLVFHILTDQGNYFAMKFWFARTRYGDAAVQVLNIDDPALYNHVEDRPLHLSLPEEFSISFYGIDKHSSLQVRTQYLSMFSHSHYLLPKILPSLEKVVVLDDDLVVQRDLSDLWSIDMAEKAIAAVQSCSVRLFHLQTYLPKSSFVDDSCAWTSGINIVDLFRWRVDNVSEKYQRLAHEMMEDVKLIETSKLIASLLTFQGQVHPLDDGWMLSGLGHIYGISSEALQTAAALHFDGSMKPWLELGIPDYKSFWREFLNLDSQFLNDCNVQQ